MTRHAIVMYLKQHGAMTLVDGCQVRARTPKADQSDPRTRCARNSRRRHRP